MNGLSAGKDAVGADSGMSKLTVESLRTITVFKPLSDAAFADLSQRCVLRHHDPGELIIGHTDQTLDVYFLLGGLARVSIYSADGQRVGFRDLTAGAIFGELSAIDSKPRSASVECVDSCSVVTMRRDHFLDALGKYPAFSLAVACHLTAQIRSLTTRVFEYSTLAVRNRVRLELLRLLDAAPESGAAGLLTQVPTHAEIASRISTHREAVSREVAWLEHNKYILKEGRSLRIADPAALRALVDEDWG